MHGNLHVVLLCKEARILWLNRPFPEMKKEELIGKISWEISNDARSNKIAFRQWCEMLRDGKCEEIFTWKSPEGKEHLVYMTLWKLAGVACRVAAIGIVYDLDSKLLELSGREKEVLAMVGEGVDRSEISDRLGISGNTIQTHIRRIRKKLGVDKTSDLVGVAALNSVAFAEDF